VRTRTDYLQFLEKMENLMAGRTVSAYADHLTASKVAEMAKIEDRSPAQIAAAALRFYVRLPNAARDAWRRIEAAGEDATDEAARAAGRALIDRQYDRLLDTVRQRQPAPLPAEASEEAVLAYAAEISRRA